MSADRYIIECKDGEMLIDGQPTDFAPPWKTENAIRQQFSDISALNDAFARLIGVRDQLRADLAAAVALTAARDETIAELELRLRISRQSNKELRESAEQATATLAESMHQQSAEVNQLRARLAAIEAAPVVAVIHDSHGHLSVARKVVRLPAEGTELIAKPAKDAP